MHHTAKVTRLSVKGPVVNVSGLQLWATLCLCELLALLSAQDGLSSTAFASQTLMNYPHYVH